LAQALNSVKSDALFPDGAAPPFGPDVAQWAVAVATAQSIAYGR